MINPYESPMLNVDEARYDRTLFWRVAKFLLGLAAVLVVLNFGIWVLRPGTLGVQGTDDAISFLSGHNGWLRDQLDRVRDVLQ
jgi:hypothetical protein